jgi:homopolymeric O-antigen transport system ATP-binding protein
MRPIIKVENLSKLYRIGARQAPYQTLRESLVEAVRAPLHWVQSNAQSEMNTIWALQDISFEAVPGEVLGVIGRNGAGKSTLLKILSRITEPTTGRVDLYGRAGSLLEVGTGFHPELSGRENIYLNGAILGMKRSEIDRKFDEIVEFAEVEQFIDTPVKHYSSGMYTRLAFSVAAHLEPEILIIDEVLAVGDAGFQNKCMRRMKEAGSEGRTILFVSHNMGAVQGLCQRVIWLDRGRILADDIPKKVVASYLNSAMDGFDQFNSDAGRESADLWIEKVVLKNDQGEPTIIFEFGSSLLVEVHFQARRRIERPYFWVAIASQSGSLFAANMLLDGIRPSYLEGKGVVSCLFKELALLPQLYTVSLGVRDEDGARILVKSTDVGFFQIAGAARDLGLNGEMADGMAGDATPMLVPYEWRFQDGNVRTVNLISRKNQ